MVVKLHQGVTRHDIRVSGKYIKSDSETSETT